MKRTSSRSTRGTAGLARAGLLALVLAPGLLRAQTTAPAAAKKNDEVVSLTPFEVQADSDKSYGALNSSSITRFNTELASLPISADVFTKTFMDDVAATSVESMIQTYSAGAGFATSDPGGSAATTQDGDRNGNAYIQLRGLSTPTSQRDGFMAVGAFGNPGSTGVGVTSNFDIERVEVIRGPQALLYGGGGAGGVINVVSKQARFGLQQGDALFRVTQYGAKQAQFDYTWGNDRIAARVSLLDQVVLGRRVNIGGPIHGQYLQLAARLPGHTTLRLTGEQTKFDRMVNANTSVTTVASDPRNNVPLHYLLATNQTGATNPLTGAAYPSGAIDNGLLNWGNVDSYQGWMASEKVIDDFVNLTAETEWTRWLSTQFAVGYNNYYDDRVNATFSFLAPGASGNTLPGWSGAITPSDSWQPARSKAIRFSVLATGDFFGGRAHSSTIVGADFVRTDLAQIGYGWYQASSVNGPSAARIPLPKLVWSIDQGFQLYPNFYPGAKDVTINGVEYVRQLQNPPNPALVTPANPHGVILGGSNYIITKIFNKGVFGVNSTNWLQNRLNTLVGFRLAQSDEDRLEQGSAPPAPPATRKQALANTANFNVGVNYALLSWLRPYLALSDSYDPPPVQQVDPVGNLATTAHGIGAEGGFKFNNKTNSISGSLAFYKVKSKNEEMLVSSTLQGDINPAGLNGRFGASNQWVNLDRQAGGIEFMLTAAPTSNWRARFSASTVDGTIGTTKSYAQLYNDQFYANSAGQVTYKDGTVVFVNGTATTAAQATIVAATAANATPLTLALMNNRSSIYWANPAAVTSAIASSSSVATILKTVDPVHGVILTGIGGLPISALQIAPNAANPPPGVIPVAQTGDKTVGYPLYSFAFTNVYTFSPETLLKGFRLGGTSRVGWKYRDYYYWPNGIVPGQSRVLYYLPTQAYFDLIAGYEKKFRRFTFSSQLNVANLFNHYHVLIVPNGNTGFTAGVNATFDAQPRVYTWTNEIKF